MELSITRAHRPVTQVYALCIFVDGSMARLIAESAVLHSAAVDTFTFEAVTNKVMVHTSTTTAPVVLASRVHVLRETWAVHQHVACVPAEGALILWPHSNSTTVDVDDSLWDLYQSFDCAHLPDAMVSRSEALARRSTPHSNDERLGFHHDWPTFEVVRPVLHIAPDELVRKQ